MVRELPNRVENNMVFKLSNRRSAKEVNLRSLEWAVVTQLNGEKTVGQIGEILALSEDEIQQIFFNLIGEGLLEFVQSENNINSPSPAFVNNLERQFKLYVGPIADIIINDTLNELKTSRQYMEKSQIPFFVELLSFHISNTRKRVQFQRDMLNEIQGIL
jgi:hypothetical protein